MPRFRANFTDNHLAALLAVWRLINATPQAVALSQNMPERKDYWRNYLRDLVDEKWLVSKMISVTAQEGKAGRRLGTLYALTQDGAEIIAETLKIDPSDVFYPHGGIQATSPFQFPHRADFIKILALFLGYQKASGGGFEVLDLFPYYRFNGANRFGNGKAFANVQVDGKFKTKTLVPDALMRFRIGETVRLVAIEFHRETDTRGIIEQLHKNAAAIEQGLFSRMLHHSFANHVLSIHLHADKLRNVRERIESGEFPDFDRYIEGFHFTTFSDLFERGLEDSIYTLKKEKSKLLK